MNDLQKHDSMKGHYLFIFLVSSLIINACVPHNFQNYEATQSFAPPTNSSLTEITLAEPTAENLAINSDPNLLVYHFTTPENDLYLQTFAGVVRADAKTTPSGAPCETYESVQELIETLPYDTDMYAQVGDYSPSLPEEDRNVYIKRAFIFYIAAESDNDFHIIIGDTIDGERTHFMTAEIAGLPTDTTTQAYDALRDARRMLFEQFPSFFEGKIRRTFRPISKFPEIEIRGSLFFDNRHGVGERGTGNIKPESSWEIHPVTFLRVKK